MNILLLRNFSFALLFLWSLSAKAQCLFTLEMHDSYGDGWNGGVLTITSGGNSVPYTLNNVNDDGIDSTLTFMIQDGAPFTLSYVTGSFASEVSFKIFDNGGTLFFGITAPATGVLYSGTAQCVPCANPSNFAVENVWDNRAKLRWQPNYNGSNAPVSWKVIYGPQGFSLAGGEGDTLDVNVPKVTITGLQKKTWYEAYVQQYCDVAGGYSKLVGPIAFQTYWTNDIGIAGVIAPQSGCDLGVDSVKVILANYGAAPQTFFKFRYAVNGTNAPIVPPSDGFYLGILGKDSTAVFAFKTLSDFSAPGEYRIDVFTELTGDEDQLNDTFTYYLNNRLKANYAQSFETWNGGWTPGGTKPSWQFGKPDKISLSAAASGINAWVTNLTGPINPSEYSYLESPCFDFSDLTADPAIECSLFCELQQSYDLAWLEMSVDGGQNWEKVGDTGEGQNWYSDDNQFLGLGEGWSGRTNGWVTARHSLPNAAGESEVHLRFVVATAPFFSSAGLGIDDVRIFKPFAKDLAGQSVYTLGEAAECGLETDQIVFSFVNFGSQSQSGVKVAYSINGGAAVQQNISSAVATDDIITHTFSVPFDSRDGNFEIKCWTVLSGDQAHDNDTVTYHINHQPKPLPYQENFESYTSPPTDWTYDPTFGFTVTDQHNNISKVLAFNLYGGNTEFTADMPRMGPVQPGDSLRFTYRVTNFASQGQVPTILQNGSKIEVQVSTDCGENYQTIFTISAFNHSPTIAMRERKLSLNNFVGQAIKIRFHGVWGTSDFWVDLDNINVLSCPPDMNLSAETVPATPGLSDGSATVHVGLGNPPYQYDWSDGSTTQTAANLAAGTYSVTVTDAHGCTDELLVSLGNSATGEAADFAKVSIYPNPTSGLATLQVAFGRSVDAQIEIMNPFGQRIWYISTGETERFLQAIDLNQYADGLYLVRISAAGNTMVQKLIKN